MQIKFKLIPIFFILLLTSCYSTQSVSQSVPQESESQIIKKMMESWNGHTKNQLLMSWGSPQSVTSDGENGEIITFIELKRAYFESIGYITVIHKYMFYVNSNKIIYYWNYNKNTRQGL